MEVSEFTFKIILLFIPGIVSFILIETLTVHKKIEFSRLILYSLLLGFICYSLYSIAILILNYFVKYTINFSLIKLIAVDLKDIDFRHIVFGTLLSFPVGLLISFIINHKWLHRFAHFSKISNKFGDADVLSYILNSKIPEWVVIRDKQNDLMYEGWIQVFSEGMEKDELFLRDVKVFKNSTGEELYETPGLYMPRNRENLTIEFPKLEFTEYIKRPN